MTTPNKVALMGSIQKQTKELLAQHGLTDWKVLFDRSLHRAGSCRYFEKEIVYSIHFMEVASPEERRNTMTHEVAHALAGHKAGHGPRWAEKHRKLGGNGAVKRLFPQELASHEYFLYVGTCSHCGYRTGLEDAPDGVWICRACDMNVPRQERIFTWSCDGEAVDAATLGDNYVKGLWSLFDEKKEMVSA